MDLLGIQFAPLDVPMERRLQTLAVVLITSLALFGSLAFTVTAVYMLFYTRYYWLVLIYIAFSFGERGIEYRGGRQWRFMRGWRLWKYVANYFPMKLVKTVDLDPTKNYMLCGFPHGVLGIGVAMSFGTDGVGFNKIFKGIRPYVATLDINFKLPLYKDMLLSLGFCSVSKESMSYVLGSPGTGRAIVVVPGGANESQRSKPGTYHVTLKNRKGFIKLALKHGASLVPVIDFGETNVYDQMKNPEGSKLRKIQDICRSITGIAPIIPLGRGIFQYSVGLLPQRTPLNIVVGRPIEVEKVPEPTQEQIDELHQRFIYQITTFFEEEKHKYLQNAKDIHFIIE